MKKPTTTRRDALRQIGLLGVTGTAALGLAAQTATAQTAAVPAPAPSGNQGALSSREGFLAELKQRVDSTLMVDSHEHLPDEAARLAERKSCLCLFRWYLGDDFVSAGLEGDIDALCGVTEKDDLVGAWRQLEPYWNAVKNTGYGNAVQITLKELYGIDTMSESAIPRLQQEYARLAVPGFYEKVLRGHCRIECCQVDACRPQAETAHPTLLLQDINIRDFQSAHFTKDWGARVGVSEIKDLSAYHDFMRRWFKKYGPYAVAVKSNFAYNRGLDYEKVPAEAVEGLFQKILVQTPLTPEEKKRLEDHLFWFCVDLADEQNLPVKLHTGYYAGRNGMPVSRVERNVAQVADLCLKSPKTRFVFMHTAYPYGHGLISVAKHFSNAHVQMCWAWIIDPIASKDFLKRHIVAAPSNKIHTFGGDYGNVENVVGHARIARDGIYAALSELVDEGYVSRANALELVDPLLRGNARRIFNLEQKYERARNG